MSDLERRVKKLEEAPDGCGCLMVLFILAAVASVLIDWIWPLSVMTAVDSVWVAFAQAVVAAGSLP